MHSGVAATKWKPKKSSFFFFMKFFFFVFFFCFESLCPPRAPVVIMQLFIPLRLWDMQ